MCIDPLGFNGTPVTILNYNDLTPQQQNNVASAANAVYGGFITQEEYEANLRLNGAEFNSAIVDYDPNVWKGNIVHQTNCYAYAFNMTQSPDKSIPFTPRIPGVSFAMQPGMFASGKALGNMGDLAGTDESNSILVDAVSADAAVVNYNFIDINSVTKQPEGTWTVALVVFPNYDYHWYRLDNNGKWSHKQGQMPVGSQIDNPREDAYQNGYSVFVGYYYVSPCADKSLLRTDLK